MKKEKQLTAVEWFNQQLVDRQNGNGDSRSRDEILEQAKEMEKEQMIEFASYYTPLTKEELEIGFKHKFKKQEQ